MDVLRDDLAYFIIVEIVNQYLIGIGSYEVPNLRFQSCKNDQELRNFSKCFSVTILIFDGQFST
jgi:hypothetical protein